jgi:hypothetical protein
LAGWSQRIASRARDAQEPKVDEPFGEVHNLWGASIEIKNTGVRHFDTLKECDPRGGRLAPVRRGN